MMKVISLKRLVYAAAIFAISAPAWAGTIINTSNSSNPLNALDAGPELLAQLAGTTVIFDYSFGLIGTATFNATGQAADTAGDVLSESSGVWQIQNNQNPAAISGVIIIGTGAGLTSLTGLEFPVTDGGTNGTQNGLALFTSPIGLNGLLPTGTLFAEVSISPEGGVGGGGAEAPYTFDMATQLLTGPVTNASNSPEPSTFGLLGVGLFAFAAAVRRRTLSK